jgi:hypothetical protein
MAITWGGVEMGNGKDAARAPQRGQTGPYRRRDRMTAQAGVARSDCRPPFDAETANDQAGGAPTAAI